MFKGKLIQVNKGYYRLRNRQLLYRLIPGFLAGFLAAVFSGSIDIPLWLIIAGIGFYATAVFVLYDNQKLMSLMKGEEIIEVDQTEIRLKSKKGKIEETIKLEEVEKIIVNKQFSIVQEDLTGIIDGIKGKSQKNYLIVYQNGEKRRFDFEFDSNYMMVQMKKNIKFWIEKGYQVERGIIEDDSLPLSGYEKITGSETDDFTDEEWATYSKNRDS